VRQIDDEQLKTFRERGYVVVPGVLDAGQIAEGRAIVAELLENEPIPDGHASFHFLWPRFGPDGHRLLEFYRSIGLGELAGQLLRPDLAIDAPDRAQVALTIAPFVHRPGGPHVDGITPPEPSGRPSTFTMLAGVWLADQSEVDRGNVYVWPGTHVRFGRYLAERGPDALAQLKDKVPPYPDIELGEPEQVTGPAGSVLFAHYLLGHNIGGHFGPAGSPRRETLYFRLHAHGHADRWREVVTSPLSEFAVPQA
jgi:hypothetical protein